MAENERAAGADKGSFGIWLNKRALRLVEFPLRHELQSTDNGWEVRILASGRITARYLDGGTQNFDVVSGDTLLAVNEDMYLALNHLAVDANDRIDQERRGTRQTSREEQPSDDEGARES